MEIKCDHCNFRKGTHRIGQNFYCQECFDEYNQSYSEAAECVHCKNTFTRNYLMNIDGDWYCLNCGSQHPEVLLENNDKDTEHCAGCGRKDYRANMVEDEDEPGKWYCYQCEDAGEPTGYPHL